MHNTQLKQHEMKLRVEGVPGNNLRSVIDLKGAFKLIMFLPKAGIFRAKMAEVFFFTFQLFHTFHIL